MSLKRISLALAALLLSASANAGTMLVWSDFSGNLHTAGTDGSNNQTLGNATAGGVAVDNSTGRVYWANYGSIYSANIDGSDEQLVADTGSSIVWNMVIAKGKLYFNSTGEGSTSGIGRINLDGTGLTRLGDRANGESIAYDSDHDKLYYQHFGFGEEGFGTLKTVKLSSGPTSGTLAVQPGETFMPGMFVDNVFDQLYFASGAGIFRSNLDGSNLSFIADPTWGGAYSLYVDARNNTIYYGSRGDGTIGRMDLDGGNQQTLIQTDPGFYALSLYSAQDSADVPEPGTLALSALALAGIAATRRRRQ